MNLENHISLIDNDPYVTGFNWRPSESNWIPCNGIYESCDNEGVHHIGGGDYLCDACKLIADKEEEAVKSYNP